jgi:hypothetical protein
MGNKYLGSQIDGKHYTDQKLQPVQLAEMLGATPEFCKVSKYLTRQKNDKFVNIDKADHCIGLEEDLGVSFFKYPWYVITGWKWKFFKKPWEIHNYIVEFSGDVCVQQILHYVLTKQYDKAHSCVEKYRKQEELILRNIK